MTTTAANFVSVTEIAGDEVSREQVDRLCRRYYWAGTYCEGKEVLEVACGTGQGLGYLARRAKSLVAGDCSQAILDIARRHYDDSFDLRHMDAQALPLSAASLDVIILFEAIYYLPSPEKFFSECRRALRPGGKLLIATANKDLFDFNPSPYSHQYFGVVELGQALARHGFRCEFFGDTPLDQVSWRQKMLRLAKKLVVASGLMPKSMAGKKLLKKLVFGGLVPLPAEIAEGMGLHQAPAPLPPGQPDKRHKVIFCAAALTAQN